MSTIDIVIVTYRCADVAARCLASVDGASADHSVRTVVLDNDSGDGTEERLRDAFPGVEVVGRKSNDGFAVATNEGIRHSSGDYVLVLNPDTELTPGILDRLIDTIVGDKTIGVVGPRLERLDGSFDKAAKRNSPTAAAAFTYLLSKAVGRASTSDYLAPNVPERGFGFVDAVNGAFMLLPRRVIEEVGGLDESYWMYGEDLEWCRRIRSAGYHVAYDGRVTAVHVKGSSSGRHRTPRVNWHFHRSMWIYYRTEPDRPGAVRSAGVLLGIVANWLFTTAAGVVAKVTRR